MVVDSLSFTSTMFRSLVLIFAFAQSTYHVINCSNQTANDVSEATANLALALLKNSGSNKNAFLSPFSISTCLGMVYVGAKGETKKQINKVVYSGLPDSTIVEGLKNDSDRLSRVPKGYTFNVANRAYSAKKWKVLDSYNESLVNDFNSDIVEINFAQSEKSRKTINDWVQDKTNDKIKDLLPKQSIDDLTKIVLINAVYFKGDWKFKFDKRDTKEDQFFLNEDKYINISMMTTRTNEYYFYRNKDLNVLGMPFKNETMFMYIVVPEASFGLSKVEESLKNGKDLLNLFDKTKKTDSLTVKIPKFKMTKQLPLKDTLIKMNLTVMFSSNADLSGISDKSDLHVSDAFHKAAFEINEDGAEASAASAAVVATRTMPPLFVANFPFIFAIVHRETKTILFIGRFADDKFD